MRNKKVVNLYLMYNGFNIELKLYAISIIANAINRQRYHIRHTLATPSIFSDLAHAIEFNRCRKFVIKLL